jgi:hemoglobin
VDDADRHEVGMRPRAARWSKAAQGLAVVMGIVAVVGLIGIGEPVQAQAPETPRLGGPTLYQRIGGYDRIAALVDTAFPRVASHPELNHLFRGHALDTNIRQRQLIIDRLCHDSGGPCAYTGRPLRTVHTNLKISAAQWEVFIKIIGDALQELKFGDAERREFLELFRTRYRGETIDL